MQVRLSTFSHVDTCAQRLHYTRRHIYSRFINTNNTVLVYFTTVIVVKLLIFQ